MKLFGISTTSPLIGTFCSSKHNDTDKPYNHIRLYLPTTLRAPLVGELFDWRVNADLIWAEIVRKRYPAHVDIGQWENEGSEWREEDDAPIVHLRSISLNVSCLPECTPILSDNNILRIRKRSACISGDKYFDPFCALEAFRVEDAVKQNCKAKLTYKLKCVYRVNNHHVVPYVLLTSKQRLRCTTWWFTL